MQNKTVSGDHILYRFYHNSIISLIILLFKDFADYYGLIAVK